MADLIELVCECGKVLKVPRSRAGQTGKCAKCMRPVMIPMVEEQYEDIADSQYQAPTGVPSNLGNTLDVSQTAARPSPFGQNNDTSSHFPSSSLADTQKRTSFNTGVPNTKPYYAEEQSFGYQPEAQDQYGSQAPMLNQQPPMAGSPFSQPQAEGVYGTGFQETSHDYSYASDYKNSTHYQNGQQCPKCSQYSPEDAENCIYCGEDFYSVLADSTVQRKKTAKTKNKSKAFKRRKQHEAYLKYAIIFLLGIFAGILISPGYLNLVPDKNKLLGVVGKGEKITESVDTTDINKKKTPETKDDDDNFDFDEDKDKDKKKPDMVVEDKGHKTQPKASKFDLKLKDKTDKALVNVDIYMQALQKDLTELDKYKTLLASKYNILQPKTEEIVFKGKRLQKGLKERVVYAKAVYRRKLYKYEKKAYNYLKPYRNLNPKTSSIMRSIKKEIKRLKAEYIKYKRFYDKQKTMSSGNYMGRWYKRLAKGGQIIASLCDKNYRVSSTSASMKIQSIKLHVKKIKGYKRDINEAANKLLSTMKTKNVERWIKWRKAKAISRPQLRQAKIIEDFVKTKKFSISMTSELRKLNSAVKEFRSSVRAGRVGESVARRLLQTLQAIDRKFRDPYEDFNSAVYNFEAWNN